MLLKGGPAGVAGITMTPINRKQFSENSMLLRLFSRESNKITPNRNGNLLKLLPQKKNTHNILQHSITNDIPYKIE